MIAENIRQVHSHIENACLKGKRDNDKVDLIAVTKTMPVSMLWEAYKAGERNFGENRVQELLRKREELPADIRWHMIGHLQRNKVKDIVGKVVLIHSVDSLRLAEEIHKECIRQNIVMDILIEVNVSGEESKFGISPQSLENIVRQVSILPGVCIKGLMTIAPYTQDPENNRKYFRFLKELAVDIKHKNVDNVSMDILSMGMTGDYEVAIEEGATYVRVGTGIFGMRNPSDLK